MRERGRDTGGGRSRLPDAGLDSRTPGSRPEPEAGCRDPRRPPGAGWCDSNDRQEPSGLCHLQGPERAQGWRGSGASRTLRPERLLQDNTGSLKGPPRAAGIPVLPPPPPCTEPWPPLPLHADQRHREASALAGGAQGNVLEDAAVYGLLWTGCRGRWVLWDRGWERWLHRARERPRQRRGTPRGAAAFPGCALGARAACDPPDPATPQLPTPRTPAPRPHQQLPTLRHLRVSPFPRGPAETSIAIGKAFSALGSWPWDGFPEVESAARAQTLAGPHELSHVCLWPPTLPPAPACGRRWPRHPSTRGTQAPDSAALADVRDPHEPRASLGSGGVYPRGGSSAILRMSFAQTGPAAALCSETSNLPLCVQHGGRLPRGLTRPRP